MRGITRGAANASYFNREYKKLSARRRYVT
jgi:hypothetical protein